MTMLHVRLTAKSRFLVLRRFYASHLDQETQKIIDSYPTSPHATPYEILNISNKDAVTDKELKRAFFKLAKIYHPDVNRSKEEDDSSISKKDERFKKILAAYHLLKNPVTRANYDKYNLGWNDSSSLRTSPNFYSPNSPEYARYARRNSAYSGFTSYETGTWEDRYRYGYDRAYGFKGTSDEGWNTSETGTFKDEFTKNRKTIFLSIFFTAFVYTSLQLSHLYLYDDLIGENYPSNLVVDVHEKSEDDLFHAYTNYGLGDTKQDRINRFLWWRQMTMTFSLRDIKEVLDHFYKRGIIDADDEQAKLREFKK